MYEDGKQLVDMVYLKKEKIFHHTMRLPIIPVSYTHLDVYKRQVLYIMKIYYMMNLALMQNC